MTPSLRTIFFSRKSLLLYSVELCLLLLSVYGFGFGAHKLLSGDPVLMRGSLVFMVLLGVTPLTLFIYIAMRQAMHVGQVWSSLGYQHRINQLQNRINAQDDFFHAINQGLPTTLLIYNNQDEYWFANANAARELNTTETDLVGKKPSDVLGAERGRKLVKLLEQVRQSHEPVSVLERHVNEAKEEVYIQTSYRHLEPFGEFPGGVMARGENVTTIVLERARREDMLRRTIATLVGVVDRRDPYASGHSSRVGQLSRALAEEMKLPEREVEAAEISGSLMNFGKVLVSRRILTKTESLTPEELQRIRDSILVSADILSPIDFGVPVVPTLRQVLEHFDGSGSPQQIKGESILLTARIVAVSNAFVALVSQRAYRPGLASHLALEQLANAAGRAFDPRVIKALGSFLTKSASQLDWLK